MIIMYSTKSQRIKNYKSMVSTYYDVITQQYPQFWGEFFHPAIFENPNDVIKTALLKTNRRF